MSSAARTARCTLLVLAVGLVLAGGRASARPRLPPELAAWPEGPVHWLLLPDEAAAFASLSTPEEARAFIQRFWERRDPVPGEAVNTAAQRFFDRVAMADKLYVEEDRRGSLTDRGGALILLGSPAILRVLRRRTPALDASRPGRAGEVQEIPVEVWGWRPQDVPELVRQQPDLATEPEITITFEIGRNRASILEGRSLLRLAARAAVLRP